MMANRPAVVVALRDSHLAGGGVRPVSIGGLSAFDHLRAEAKTHHYAFMRDYEWSAAGCPGDAYLLWDIATYAVLPRFLRRSGLIPAVAWTLESPLVAHRAYHRLDAISREVDTVATFSGAAALVAPGTRFEPLCWPNDDRVVRGDPWRERRFLCLVNSNKRANVGVRDVGWRGPVGTARTLAATALAASYRLRGSWTVPDLYEERLRVIAASADQEGFDLFGVGWDKPVAGATGEIRKAVKRSYRGAVDDKGALLGKYRFVMVLENTVFPGYVTEKVFDAMLAGAIPAYLGAPDIDRILPEGTYIDLRAFEGDYAAASQHMRSLTEAEVDSYLTRARTFLASRAFDRFTAGNFARRMIGLVDACAARRGGHGA